MGHIAGDAVWGYEIDGKVICLDGCDRDIDVDNLTKGKVSTSDQADSEDFFDFCGKQL